jgi:hypothetical protein
MCTGCFWEFQVRNWDYVDYIEVWSEAAPHRRYKNALAFDWWTGLLNQGKRLAAAAGRDWHGVNKAEDALLTATYLGLENGEISARTVRDALKKGRSFVTLGPRVEFSLSAADGRCFGIGEEIPPGRCRLSATVSEETQGPAAEGLRVQSAVLAHNGKPLRRFPCSGAGPFSFSWDFSSAELPERGASSWLRLELYGDCDGKSGELLAFTSPVYLA